MCKIGVCAPTCVSADFTGSTVTFQLSFLGGKGGGGGGRVFESEGLLRGGDDGHFVLITGGGE